MNKTNNIRTKVIIGLLVLIVIILAFKTLNIGSKKDSLANISSVGTTYIANAPKSNNTDDEERIVYNGYKEYVINSENRNIEFYNDAANSCSIVYRVIDIDTGDVVIQSNAVAPGECCFADIYYYYNNIGNYSVQIQSLPFNNNGDMLNGLNYNVNVKVI